MDNVKIEKRDGAIEEMSVDEFSRWMCLAEAFHFIEKKAEELNVDVEKMLKPLAIERYIIDRFPSMRHDVGVEIEMGLI
jgi:hypothetical protein